MVLKSLKGQQLNGNEVYAINSDKVEGLLHMDVVQKGGSFQLIYNITGLVTLRSYLTTPLNKERFANILQNILMDLKSVTTAYFNRQYLLFDLDRVMVNPATQRIFFVYVPIQFFESGTTLKGFLLSIIQSASFVSDENTEYVRDYISILNSGVNFSVFDLEEYINKLSGQRYATPEFVECPKCRMRLEKGTNFCHACGAKVKTFDKYRGDGVYDPLASINESRQHMSVQFPQGEPPCISDMTPFHENASQSSPQNETEYAQQVSARFAKEAFLLREKNGECIVINSPDFKLGKGYGNDYVISDNAAVSRAHAEILTFGDKYYVCDLNSTNRTYIDGIPVTPTDKTELFSGCKLTLANESFIFYIE